MAALIGADPREIVFTSGATEANNLAIKGAAWASKPPGGHLVTAVAEHKSVLDPMMRLARDGWSVTILPVDRHGQVDPEAVAAALTDRTILVSIMAANNEVGTLNPIAEMARHCRARGVLFHTDATQAAGKVSLNVERNAIDLLSLTGHKFHGPKGIGILYVRRRGSRVRLVPLLDGGGHERGFRSGTLPVPLIVGLGVAAEIAAREGEEESRRVAALRDRLHTLLSKYTMGMTRNGHPSEALPNNLNVSFEGVEGEALLMNIRDVAVSSGSACSSAQPETSHVLQAMSVPEHLARASLRFGLGRFTTLEEIEFAARYVADVILKLRAGAGAGPP